MACKDSGITSNSYRLQTVVLDAGHGGKDDGCSGKHSKEKHLALNITLALGNAIETAFPAVQVIYTRTSDVFIPLYRRAAIANENNADLFISIHCNAMGEKLAYIRGTETFVMGVQSSDNHTASRENQSVYLEKDYLERYQGFDTNSNEGHIFSSIFQNAYLGRSILLAEKIEKYVVQFSKRRSRGVRQDDFVVLRETEMPSVLVETGFLTNSKDEVYLNSNTGQRDMANAIFLAFKEYKEEVERETATLITTPVIEEPIVYIEPIIEEELPKEETTYPIEKETSASAAPYRATEPIPFEEPKSESIVETIPIEPVTEASIEEKIFKEEVIEDTPIEEPTHPIEKETSTSADSYRATEPNPFEESKSESIVETIPVEPVIETPKEEIIKEEIIEKTSTIQFSIQLAASLTPIDTTTSKWKQLQSLEVRQDKKLFKYFEGDFLAYEKAAQHRINLTKQGFKGAFVVAYQDGKRISLQKAKEISKSIVD